MCFKPVNNLLHSCIFLLGLSLQTVKSHKPRCGGLSHAASTRPCAQEDTYCGEWINRFWTPTSCYYEDITPTKAVICLGNRTLAFMGDSQTRDIATGVVYFLLEAYTLQNAPETKADKDLDLTKYGENIGPFSFWKNNVPMARKGVKSNNQGNGYFYPNQSYAKEHSIQWQVQFWSMYTKDYVKGRLYDVMTNRPAYNSSLSGALHPIDLLFVNIGIHEWGFWFHEKQHKTRKGFYNSQVGKWIKRRSATTVPSVWLSMNPECPRKFEGLVSHFNGTAQALNVEVANKYTSAKLLEEGLPYWDVGSYLRTPGRCNISADGLHVKMFVNIMAAKMLFNHLCDEQGNWRGGEAQFV